MASILIYDESVAVNLVKADLAIKISRFDNLQLKIRELAQEVQSKFISATPGWFHELHIYCNSNRDGLQLGTGINHENVTGIFTALRFKVGSITIHDCNASFVYTNANNGILMCKKLACAVYANVTSSINDPEISSDNNANSTVVTWNQFGHISSLMGLDHLGKMIYVLQRPGLNAISRFKRVCRQKNNQSIKKQHPFIWQGLKKAISLIGASFTHHPQPATAKVVAKP